MQSAEDIVRYVRQNARLDQYGVYCIGGGALLDLELGRKPRDIDVFCTARPIHYAENANPPMQFIICSDPYTEILEKFDFTINSVGIDVKHYNWIRHPHYRKHVNERQLRVLNSNAISIRRMLRMIEKGLTPDPPTIAACLAASVRRLPSVRDCLLPAETILRECEFQFKEREHHAIVNLAEYGETESSVSPAPQSRDDRALSRMREAVRNRTVSPAPNSGSSNDNLYLIPSTSSRVAAEREGSVGEEASPQPGAGHSVTRPAIQTSNTIWRNLAGGPLELRPTPWSFYID